MIRAVILIAMCGASAFAESNFSAPLVGVARDHHQQLRLVYGLAGNFVVRDVAGQRVVNWSFGGGQGLAKAQTEVLLLGPNAVPVRRITTPHGPVLLAAGGAHTPALCFFVETGELWQMLAQSERRVPLEPDAVAGKVVALGASEFHKMELAVCRSADLWRLTVDLKTGSVVHEMSVGGAIGELACQPTPSSALLIVKGRLLLATARGLIVETTPGNERHIPFSVSGKTAPELHQAGDNWVQIELESHAPLLGRLTGDGVKLYQLPVAEARP